MNFEIINFLKTALECSVLIATIDPGLSFQELSEIGKRAGYLEGEINDALPHVGMSYFGTKKVVPAKEDTNSWVFFFPEHPDYRNIDAFDYIISELNMMTRNVGSAQAVIERNVLVERAVAKGIPRADVQVAITWPTMSEQLVEKDGLIRFSHGGIHGLPSDQLKSRRMPIPRPQMAKAYPIVKDVIERRGNGRAASAEPLDAFADELDKLGYHPFRLWWTQTVAELRHTDPNSAPISASVLAAALVEGALTFIVGHARQAGQFQSSDYEKDPQRWKIEKLVASAASGGPSAILDSHVRARADTLIKSRQRIHAGRMLSDYPGGPPDIRPDEARDAKTTAENVVRAILDWLQAYPVTS